jgi:hypothetical protein
MPHKEDTSLEPKISSLSFRLEGDIADLFLRCREAAKKNPQFWIHANLTKADFARHLIMKSLLEMARDLGQLPEDLV